MQKKETDTHTDTHTDTQTHTHTDTHTQTHTHKHTEKDKLISMGEILHKSLERRRKRGRKGQLCIGMQNIMAGICFANQP